MGQKVNPHGLRVGIIKPWSTQWYANKKDFSVNLVEDNQIREFIKEKYYNKAISKIAIKRVNQDLVTVSIYSGRAGALAGKDRTGYNEIKKEIEKITKGKTVNISIIDVKKPDANAQLVAEKIAFDLEKRVGFRRAMKSALSTTKKAGVKGVKVMVSGRLDGAEIARSESYREGSIPLQTLRADIDYGVAEAHTTFGILGVKVWIYHGEVLSKNPLAEEGGRA